MTEPRMRASRGAALLLALVAAPGASPAGGPDLRLARASADGAGGGVSEGPTFAVVLAYGQPDAQPPAFGATHAFAGGVFAALPIDRVFIDGFE